MKINIGTDKIMHFAVCTVAAVGSPWLAIGLGIGKEYGDYKAENNTWSWSDLAADGVGVIVGGVIHFIIFSKL